MAETAAVMHRVTEGEFNAAAFHRLSDLHLAVVSAMQDMNHHHLYDGQPDQRPYGDLLTEWQEADAAFHQELGNALPLS